MFLTVEEAEKTWCPQARVTPSEGSKNVSYNKIVEGDKITLSKGAKCLANGCACWRWEGLAEIDPTTDQAEKRGYCGLAGRPCS